MCASCFLSSCHTPLGRAWLHHLANLGKSVARSPLTFVFSRLTKSSFLSLPSQGKRPSCYPSAEFAPIYSCFSCMGGVQKGTQYLSTHTETPVRKGRSPVRCLWAGLPCQPRGNQLRAQLLGTRGTDQMRKEGKEGAGMCDQCC